MNHEQTATQGALPLAFHTITRSTSRRIRQNNRTLLRSVAKYYQVKYKVERKNLRTATNTHRNYCCCRIKHTGTREYEGNACNPPASSATPTVHDT